MPKPSARIPVSEFFRPNEVQALLKPGELEEQILAPADKAVVRAVDACRGHRVTVNGIMKRTGLSLMAVTLASYRLVAVGLLQEAPAPKGWKYPKNYKAEPGFPKPTRQQLAAEARASVRRARSGR